MKRKRLNLGLIAAVLLALLAAAGPKNVLASKSEDILVFQRSIDISPQNIFYPLSLAKDGKGNFYISDTSPDAPRVLKYDRSGKFIRQWGSLGNGPGQFAFWPSTPGEGPNGGFLTVDAQGNVFVSDSFNARIQKFDTNGNFLMQFGEPGIANGQFDGGTGPVYLDSRGNIYVSTFSRVQKFNPSGKFLAAYGGSIGSAPGQFIGAALGGGGLRAIDEHGNMYVADVVNNRVQVLDRNGSFLRAWGTPGTGNGQFFMPVGVILDRQGRVYVTDNNNRLQIFNKMGKFLGELSKELPHAAPITRISMSWIDEKNDLYLVEGGSSLGVTTPVRLLMFHINP
jgi:sugar lactone lactonase YvrE